MLCYFIHCKTSQFFSIPLNNNYRLNIYFLMKLLALNAYLSYMLANLYFTLENR
jgi:hypothetical protein